MDLQKEMKIILDVDVKYGIGGERPLRLDIIRLAKMPKKPASVIAWIHGGGWRGGDKQRDVSRLISLVKCGYFCVSIEYRLSQESKYPAQIFDCKCAIRFLRAKAKYYNINPDKIGVWGASAGGHLAALLGTTGGVKEFEGNGGWPGFSSDVQAVCDWFGPTDFLQIDGKGSEIIFSKTDSPTSQLIGGPAAENKEKAEKANPINYISKDTPPFYIVHGDKDPQVPINQSELLYSALKKKGIDVSFDIIKDGGHGFTWAEEDRLGEKVKIFFDKHLE